MKQPTLQTKRLTMLQFTLEDASAVQSLAGNCKVAKETMNIAHPYESGMAESWISGLQQAWDEKKAITYAVILKKSKKLIGAVGLVGLWGTEGSMGYWIGEPYWGQGYCTEATRALIDFCFNELKLTRIEAEYLVSNPASGRVMQKAGMTYKTDRVIDGRDGSKVELNVYEIKRDRIND